MMRSPERMAVAVRTPAGIMLDTKELGKPGAKKPWYRRVWFVRGAVSFVDMLAIGVQSLNMSASLMGIEEEPGKFEQWVSKKTGKSANGYRLRVCDDPGPGAGRRPLLYFAERPDKPLKKAVESSFLLNLIDGGVRLVIFVLYLLAVSLMPDIKRFFAYHGAEAQGRELLRERRDAHP